MLEARDEAPRVANIFNVAATIINRLSQRFQIARSFARHLLTGNARVTAPETDGIVVFNNLYNRFFSTAKIFRDTILSNDMKNPE